MKLESKGIAVDLGNSSNTMKIKFQCTLVQHQPGLAMVDCRRKRRRPNCRFHSEEPPLVSIVLGHCKLRHIYDIYWCDCLSSVHAKFQIAVSTSDTLTRSMKCRN